jgi:hypothetical protein
MVLLILALIWAAVLLPPWLRRRREGRPGDSVLSFRRQLSTLERAAPGGGYAAAVAQPIGRAHPRSVAPMSRSAARKRRRDVFYALLGATAATLLLAVAMRGVMVYLSVLCLAALGAYVALLVQIQRRTAERMQKVRPLRPQTVMPDPAYLLRRPASNS